MNSSPPDDETTAPQPAPQAQPAPVIPVAKDPRRRLQELLAISDRDRTDAQWDELVELEIQMAPGNKADSGNMPGSNNRQNPPPRQRSGPNPGSNKPRQHSQQRPPRQQQQQPQQQTQQPSSPKPGGGQMHRRRKPAPK